MLGWCVMCIRGSRRKWRADASKKKLLNKHFRRLIARRRYSALWLTAERRPESWASRQHLLLLSPSTLSRHFVQKRITNHHNLCNGLLFFALRFNFPFKSFISGRMPPIFSVRWWCFALLLLFSVIIIHTFCGCFLANTEAQVRLLCDTTDHSSESVMHSMQCDRGRAARTSHFCCFVLQTDFKAVKEIVVITWQQNANTSYHRVSILCNAWSTLSH